MVDNQLQAAGPLVIDVQDIDGHAKVRSVSFMENPDDAVRWAVAFNGAWRQNHLGSGSNDFVMQVMWENRENSYHAGTDASYVSKLAFV